MGITFLIKDGDEFTRKVEGLTKFFESKHPDAKFSGYQEGTNFYVTFAYDNEADVIENPYNLENIGIFLSYETKGGIIR